LKLIVSGSANTLSDQNSD